VLWHASTNSEGTITTALLFTAVIQDNLVVLKSDFLQINSDYQYNYLLI